MAMKKALKDSVKTLMDGMLQLWKESIIHLKVHRMRDSLVLSGILE